MVPDPSRTALGLEYFVQEGDELWTATDEDLIALGRKEVDLLGLASAEKVLDGTVLRMKKAYPVYDEVYKQALETIRTWLEGLPNLQLIGRNGQHRYNNQDHSMMTAVFAARNIDGAAYDVWGVNVDQAYHEEKSADEDEASGEDEGTRGDRLTPERVREEVGALLAKAFARYDPVALGVAVGAVTGLGLALATALLLLFTPEGHPVGPTLSLLGNYLVGYEVSWAGVPIALAEAGLVGFLFGWLLAGGLNFIIDVERRRFVRLVQNRRALSLLRGEEE